MGVDSELKINPTKDDDKSSSTFGLQLAKGNAIPFFLSNETNSMFILTAKLTGFAKDDIGITINGSGTRIEISWGQPVQKMEITRRTYKKETKTRRFKKVFQIPEGVVLDEIKATYDDEESVLKIAMPKLADGVLGVGIEEVKEQEVGETGEIPHSAAKLETLETGRETELVENSHGNEEDSTVNGGENSELEALAEIEYVAEKMLEEIEKLKGNKMEDIDGDSSNYSESEQLEKEAIRENHVNGEIKVPKERRSMEETEVAEASSLGTAKHQKEKQLNAEEHKGDITTMINKKPEIKTQSQASIDRDAQALDREYGVIKKKPYIKTQPQASIDRKRQVLDQELLHPNQQSRAEQEKQESYKNVRELKEPETDKEPGDIKSSYLQSPANENEEKRVDQKGKSLQTKDEIKEAREECKSPQKETREDSSKEAKQDSKQFRIRTPIIIAGSALFASLVIVVFNLVKSKRHEKNRRG